MEREFFLVYTPNGHNPCVRHNDLITAENECLRLASKEPNKDFFVVKAMNRYRGLVSVDKETLIRSR